MGNKDFKGGQVTLIILILLSEQDMYGYQISHLMEERSEGMYFPPDGVLYPTLYKLAEKGYISAEKREGDGNTRARIYYHLEQKGVEYLAWIRSDFLREREGVEKILKKSKGGSLYDGS